MSLGKLPTRCDYMIFLIMKILSPRNMHSVMQFSPLTRPYIDKINTHIYTYILSIIHFLYIQFLYIYMLKVRHRLYTCENGNYFYKFFSRAFLSFVYADFLCYFLLATHLLKAGMQIFQWADIWPKGTPESDSPSD